MAGPAVDERGAQCWQDAHEDRGFRSRGSTASALGHQAGGFGHELALAEFLAACGMRGGVSGVFPVVASSVAYKKGSQLRSIVKS